MPGPGQVWDSMEVIDRVNLCRSVSISGKIGSAPWEKVDVKNRGILVPLLLELDGEEPPKDTDPSDRSIHAAWSSGKPVYRASMAGRCIKELFLWRIGTGQSLTPRDEGYETTDKGVLAAREGERHETWLVQDLIEQGYELSWTGKEQRPLERRYKRYIVRSHPDGMIRGKELGDTWRVLECKALNEDRYALWLTAGWDAFPNYAHQVSIEMDLSSANAFFIVKNRNTGDSIKHLIDLPPINPKLIYRKFSLIEDIIEAAEEGIEPAAPPCPGDAEWYFCPFFNIGKCDILQGKDAEELEEVDDPQFIGILRTYREAKEGIKQLTTTVDSIRTVITDRMVKERLRVGSFFVAYTQKERRGFNIPAAKQRLAELGDDPANFDKTSSYMELRVTGGKDDEE